MKRFLLFEFDDYYPRGGWDDMTGDFDTQDAAERHRMNTANGDNYQIVDTHLPTQRVIADNRHGRH